MTNTVILKKDGFIENDEDIIKADLLTLKYLQCIIELEDGYTLRSFFEMIAIYSIFHNLNPDFLPFICEFLKLPKEGCLSTNIDYLLIDMIVNGYKDDYEHYYHLHGCNENMSDISIDFLPLKNILDIPIKIGSTYINHEECQGLDILLYDFIIEIMHSLSFFGTPQERDEVIGGLE